jgi:DNA-directed RNA polymerase specialized sigma24 family protein
MTTPTDRDLILRARRGDAEACEAFGELVTLYQTSVFNVCYRILHERGEAEDLAQETFIRAYDRICTPSTSSASSARGFGASPPTCASTTSSRKRSQPSWTMNGMQIKPNCLNQVKRFENEASKFAARSRPCPPHYRVVVELRHYQELSYEEIAEELKIPLSDVKSHLFRARKLLAEKLHAPD